MVRPADTADHELMARTRASDADAFAALVDRHTRAVVSFLRRYCGDAQRAEDLGQEVFFRVYRAAPAYQPTARFTTWLFAIALNVARDAYKFARRRPPLQFGDGVSADGDERFASAPGGAPDVLAARDEERAAVREAVDRLPEPYRTALLLRDLQGFSYEAVAELLGCPLGTVKSRVNRARLIFAETWGRTAGVHAAVLARAEAT